MLSARAIRRPGGLVENPWTVPAFVAVLVLFALAVAAQAQTTGAIEGTVTDPTQAATSGEGVRLTNEKIGVNHTTSTNNSGDFLVEGLTAGVYDITVSQPGFKVSFMSPDFGTRFCFHRMSCLRPTSLPSLQHPFDAAMTRDYNSHMVKTLRESKAKLSELVDLASRGEEVLITVRGKVKARLVPAAMPRRLDDRAVWVASLRGLHRKYGVRKAKTRGEDILSEIREDRF